MTEAYTKAREAKVGEFVICPCCGNGYLKIFYNQVFCSNAKTKRFNNCKDKYWNRTDPKKRNNTTRISPANKAYYENVILPRQDFDDDMGWDAHKDY
jgi:hypothetical protein